MTEVVIIENQSVLDAVTQHLGTPEASFEFCLANGKALSDDMLSNEIVIIPESINKITEISNYFAEKKVELATGYPLIDNEVFGIGEMIILQTFTVT
jgi:molybdenum cofactor biosynthesis enzyme MoaA